MKTRFRFLLLFIFLLMSTEGVALAQYLHPKLDGKQTTVGNVVILPAKVEIARQGVKGTESMVEESENASSAVSDLVAQVLQKKGINALESPFPDHANEAGDDQKYLLADIQSRYDALLPKLMKNSNDVKKGRFTLGDEVMNLNLDQSVDALVFIRGQGKKLTAGKTFFTIINPLDFSSPFVSISIGIVDAHTGEVLAFTKPIKAGNVVGKEQKKLNKPITKALKKL